MCFGVELSLSKLKYITLLRIFLQLYLYKWGKRYKNSTNLSIVVISKYNYSSVWVKKYIYKYIGNCAQTVCVCVFRISLERFAGNSQKWLPLGDLTSNANCEDVLSLLECVTCLNGLELNLQQ